MSPGWEDVDASALVGIVRDFLDAHGRLRAAAQAHRHGALGFAEIQRLVGDDEESVLFRLKERSHALFRERGLAASGAIGPEALFDLAVGALFHEAMKFRENFYQRDVYGPKVRALREAALPDAAELLDEFERILAGADERLAESLREVEALLTQMMRPFQALLRAHAGNGFVARFMTSRVAAVEEVFGAPLDAVLEAIHGSAGLGWARAGLSHLQSGFFAEAIPPLDAAGQRGEQPATMARLGHYARGMKAYLEGRFADVIRELSAWVDAGPGDDEAAFAELALSVLSRVGSLVEPDAQGELAQRAAELTRRLRAGEASRTPRAAAG